MPNMNNEKTSARVASDAGALLKKKYLALKLEVPGRAVEFFVMVPRLDMKRWRGVLASALTQARDKGEVERLRKRLEVTHVWQFINGKMRRRTLKPGEDIPDGIECRDETIRQLDRYIKELQGTRPARKRVRR